MGMQNGEVQGCSSRRDLRKRRSAMWTSGMIHKSHCPGKGMAGTIHDIKNQRGEIVGYGDCCSEENEVVNVISDCSRRPPMPREDSRSYADESVSDSDDDDS